MSPPDVVTAALAALRTREAVRVLALTDAAAVEQPGAVEARIHTARGGELAARHRRPPG
ncbi:hypothetical protein [Streptomyces sp. NPDC059651]|uniref:hypothetical protein n=1 Tax=unclassified Streptomyces TaxID=2593676 RepID=UPI000A77607B